ncbi:MAG: hypothetical protein ACLP3C_24085 [Mycobacterium sp.]|uniref:hypothetical protein n=1 Tax=Mycobacterium sp. TaxID=1785 RepID=UPI003F99ED6E
MGEREIDRADNNLRPAILDNHNIDRHIIDNHTIDHHPGSCASGCQGLQRVADQDE